MYILSDSHNATVIKCRLYPYTADYVVLLPSLYRSHKLLSKHLLQNIIQCLQEQFAVNIIAFLGKVNLILHENVLADFQVIPCISRIMKKTREIYSDD